MSCARCSASSVVAWPRKSMLVRTAVSGVRSSWLASTTRRCCCSRDVSSAMSMVLKLGGEPARPRRRPSPGSAWSRSWVSAMCSAVSVSCSMGRVARRITSQAASAASAMPARAMSTRRVRSTSSTSSVSDTSRAICTAPPLRSDAVSMRYCVAVDGHVAVAATADRSPRCARSSASIGSDGWSGSELVTLPSRSMVCCTASNSK